MANIDWKSICNLLTNNKTLANLNKVVELVDQDAFRDEAALDIGKLVRFTQIAPQATIELEMWISSYYTDMGIADKIANVGYIRNVLVSRRFDIPDPFAVVIAHLIVVSNTLEPTEKVKSDATYLCARILRDDFTTLVHILIAVNLITAAFPSKFVAFLSAYASNLQAIGGVLPAKW